MPRPNRNYSADPIDALIQLENRLHRRQRRTLAIHTRRALFSTFLRSFLWTLAKLSFLALVILGTASYFTLAALFARH